MQAWHVTLIVVGDGGRSNFPTLMQTPPGNITALESSLELIMGLVIRNALRVVPPLQERFLRDIRQVCVHSADMMYVWFGWKQEIVSNHCVLSNKKPPYTNYTFKMLYDY